MGIVVAMERKVERRICRLVNPGDQIINNTDGELHLRDVRGALIELMRPGYVFTSDVPVECYFDSDTSLNFRSYVNQESPHEHVY